MSKNVILYNIVSNLVLYGGDFNMEPQEMVYCYNNEKQKCGKTKNCLGIVGIILLAVFTLVIGLLIGAALAAVILAALPAIIVLAIILGILLALTIILILCNRKKDKKDKCKCCCS